MDLRRFFSRWLGGATLALVALAPTLATAQIDPPGRVARISLQEGNVMVAADARGAWGPADYNLPLTSGARIVADPGARTELHAGSTAIRLLGRADLTIAELHDDMARLTLADGTVATRVRDLFPGERFEIDSPNLALVAQQPGEYRLDVDPRTDSTRVTVHSGVAQVFGEGGESLTLSAPQQRVFGGRRLAALGQATGAGRDAFDQWVAARDSAEDQSRSALYISREIPGYAQLDQYGDWSDDPSYGAVWFPRVAAADWAPYRDGRWSWVDPWGWTWIDEAPWGFAPFHYGRWAQIGPRWAWVPGPRAQRPAYAPALVGFVGGAGSQWGVSLAGGALGAAWFPLAPFERWEPPYGASSRYRSRINPWDDRARPPANSFHFQRRPHAITVAPRDQFGGASGSHRGRYIDGSRLPAHQMGDMRVVAPPPRGFVPGTPPLAMPRPDAHGMTDPRHTRSGRDRGFAPERPLPAEGWPRRDAVPVRPNPTSPAWNGRGSDAADEWQRHGTPMRPAAPVPGAQPGIGRLPGFDPARAERERTIRDGAERDGAAQRAAQQQHQAQQREQQNRAWQQQRQQQDAAAEQQRQQQWQTQQREQQSRQIQRQQDAAMAQQRQQMHQRQAEQQQRQHQQAVEQQQQQQRQPQWQQQRQNQINAAPAPQLQPRDIQRPAPPPQRRDREGDRP